LSTLDEPTFSDQQQYWDARWDRNRAPNAWQQRRGDTILALIRTLQLVRPTILDLGCATGWFTEQLSQLGSATGVDLSEHAIAIAKDRFPKVDYIAGNFFEMPLPTAHYDLVVTQEVVAHVPNQQNFVRRLAEILKPGGSLVITTANKFVMERVDFGPDPDEHIKKWLTMRELQALLAPHFGILRKTSIIPIGNLGILRFINSHKLNRALQLFCSERSLEALKERAGLGYSLIVLATKK
jgi:2-polyprenyl-3-methyl-5-hydroxy-6-metoxy-1,4-benzoquinol methylase